MSGRREKQAKKGRVLIIDDDPALVRIWQHVLQQDGWHVFSTPDTASAREYLQGEGNRQPDVVLLDLRLPNGDGAELLNVIQRDHPGTQVAVISAYLDGQRAMDIQHQGVMSIPKPLKPESIRSLVSNLASSKGQRLLRVVDSFSTVMELSKREADVLRYAVAGLNNREIADHFGCKKRTVDTYWNRIFTKTNCHSQRGVLAALVRFTCDMPVR